MGIFILKYEKNMKSIDYYLKNKKKGEKEFRFTDDNIQKLQHDRMWETQSTVLVATIK